jgi:hypothetical protein
MLEEYLHLFLNENNNQAIELMIKCWDYLFWLYYRQLFEQPHIAASHILFLTNYSENMNIKKIPRQVAFIDATWVFASGSNIKVWSDSTSLCARKRRPPSSTRYITVHDGTWNGFVSGGSLIFVTGAKSGDYQDAMNGENSDPTVTKFIRTVACHNGQCIMS